MKTRSFLTLALIGLLLVSFAHAQTQVIVKVSFQFEAGKKMLPPGQYRITEDDEGRAIKIENVNTRSEYFLPVITRAAPRNEKTALVVFDRIGEGYTLAEIWIPGMDGYMVNSTAEKHSHEVVKGER